MRVMTFFYSSNGQQTDLLIVQATFLQIKQRSSEDGKVQQNIKIQVNYDLNQSTLGAVKPFSPSLTAQMVNKPNLLSVQASFFQIKHRNSELEGKLDSKIQVSYG